MSETTTKLTLADLQAGDKVILREGYVHCNRKVVTVKRVTERQIIIPTQYNDGEIRFRKDNGRQFGGSNYNPMQILLATDELLADVELEYRVKVLSDFRFRIGKDQKKLVEEVYDFLKSKNLLK